MLAHHPTTGKPIRILHTETQIHADLKTLVWLRSSFQPSPLWTRWFAVITDIDALGLYNGMPLAIILTSGADLGAWLAVLPTVCNAGSDTLLVAPGSVIEALAQKGFTSERALVVEDLMEGYPYLGEPVAAGDSVEKVIVSLAHILRMNRIVWTSAAEREELPFGVRAQLDAWVRCCHGVVKHVEQGASDSCIPKTWLIQQYFRHPSNRRHREITTCLERNIACPLIDHILLLNEQDYPDMPKSTKIVVDTLGHRMTYYDVFQAILKNVPAGDFVVIANSDIWFNETLKHLWRIGLAERQLFLALLRWEDKGEAGDATIFGPRADSQDTWIVARDSITFTPTEDDFGFPFGKSGCDNAFALVMMRKKFLVVNPAYTIKTFHLHTTNIRNYDPRDVLYRPFYLYVDPTAIQTCIVNRNIKAIVKLPDQAASLWNNRQLGRSFVRPMLGVDDNGVKTVCSMLRRNETYVFSANEQNLWTPPPRGLPLYNLKGGTFVTSGGLISNFLELLVGDHPLWVSGWEGSAQSSLMNSIHVPHMIAVPCEPECASALSAWCLKYLPRVLELRALVKRAGCVVPEFLVPQITDIGTFLNDCEWKAFSGDIGGPNGNITVIPMMSDFNYYSEDVWALPPDKDHVYVTAEDVDLLRNLLPSTTAADEVDGPVAVFCVDDSDTSVLTSSWSEEIVDKVMPKGWKVRYVGAADLPSVRRKAFANASWIFGQGACLDWMWYAPKGATVMEFMSDMEPNGDHVHLAGACGLRYILGVIKKEPREVQRQSAMMDINKAIKTHGFQQLVDVVRSSKYEMPRLVLPAGAGLEGIWAHSGDTFREMAIMWGERNFVKVVESESTGYCWWGGVGEILLYDRPTPRWWGAIPSYQMALFGNCAPPGPGMHALRQSVWGFWPRSPRMVEAIAREHKTMRSYKQRSVDSLFLGKVENGVQREHRTKHDWSKAVTLFSMPFDSTGAAYPYTQKEYLETLCDARFGLCLPGFGPKCNREIEYMACGCVPIVTPGVDMTGYLVPPVEGVHYLRASTPDEVVAIVKAMPAERWAYMSAACREWWARYASVEGLFRLTWARIEQCRPYFNVGIPKHFLI